MLFCPRCSIYWPASVMRQIFYLEIGKLCQILYHFKNDVEVDADVF